MRAGLFFRPKKALRRQGWHHLLIGTIAIGTRFVDAQAAVLMQRGILDCLDDQIGNTLAGDGRAFERRPFFGELVVNLVIIGHVSGADDGVIHGRFLNDFRRSAGVVHDWCAN